MGILSLLIVSLIGSAHCAGMCGGFATFCASDSTSSWYQHVAYNAGRLIIYLLLGTGAALLGTSIDTIGAGLGLSQISATILGGIFIIYGFSQLFESNFPIASRLLLKLNTHFFPRYSILLERTSKRSAHFKPWTVGACSALLPCGWLYSFVAAAGATGSVSSALSTMFIFWLGTLPMMLSIGKLSQVTLKHWGLESSKVAASIMIVAGFLALGGRLGPPRLQQHDSSTEQQVECH